MKTHLNLATRDLDASVAFYRTLLAADPAKHYSDYALFLTEDPGLELALHASSGAQIQGSAHYGVVAERPDIVDAALARLQGAGYPVEVERDETCCYAVQNKVWATDPDGRRWETYFVIAESEARDNEATTCCQDEDAVVDAGASACC